MREEAARLRLAEAAGYRIKQGNGAEEFLFRTRDPMGAVDQTAESAMREVVGRKKMDSVLFESKQEIAEEVKVRRISSRICGKTGGMF